MDLEDSPSPLHECHLLDCSTFLEVGPHSLKIVHVLGIGGTKKIVLMANKNWMWACENLHLLTKAIVICLFNIPYIMFNKK